MARVPPPQGDTGGAAARADLRQRVRPVPRRRRLRAHRRRRLLAGASVIRMMGTGAGGRDRGARLLRPGDDARRSVSRPARSATSSPASRTSRSVRIGDTITDGSGARAGEALPGYKVVQPMVFCGLFPIEGDKFEELRDALEKLKLNDAALDLRARESRRRWLRLPLRLPRPAAHGDRAGAPRARVQPRARSRRRPASTTTLTSPSGAMTSVRNPGADCPTRRTIDEHRGADRGGQHHRAAERVRRARSWSSARDAAATSST